MFFHKYFSTLDFEEAASLLIAALTATCSPGDAFEMAEKGKPRGKIIVRV